MTGHPLSFHEECNWPAAPSLRWEWGGRARSMTILGREPAAPGASEAGPVITSKRATASARRVLILTIVDQGASSISNFALAILVAHYSDASEIGVFAILTTTYVIAQGLVRSLTSDCLLTRSETDDVVMAKFERAGYLAALVVSTVLALLLLALSGLLGSEFTVPVLVFALAFPLMALQDYARFVGISRHDPAYAIRLDVAWLVLFLVAYGVLRSMDLVSLPWLFGAWSGAGALVGLTTVRGHLARQGRQLLDFWVKSERAVGVRFAGQFMLVTSWTYFIVYLLVLVIALSAIGHFKLAQLSLGPITVMAAGVQSALVALAAKRFRVDTHRATRFLLLVGAGMALVTLLWTALVYAAPVHAMTSVLGPSWPQARSLVPFVGLGFALSAFSGAATSGLRAVRAAKENLQLALIMLPFLFVPCMGGAALWGAKGAAIGLCFAYAVYAVLGWFLLERVVRRLGPVPGEVLGPDPVEVAAEVPAVLSPEVLPMAAAAVPTSSAPAMRVSSIWMSKLGAGGALSEHGNEEEAPPQRRAAAIGPFGSYGAPPPRRRPPARARHLNMAATDGLDDEARTNLREYLHTLRRRRWVIIVVTAACVGLSLAYSAVTKPVYQATANLLLTPQLSSTLLQANNSNIITAVDVPTDIQLVESDPVASFVRKSIPDAPAVSAAEVGTTDVVAVSVQSTNPKLAASAATAYAKAYISVGQQQAVNSLSSAAAIVQNNVISVQNQINSVQGQIAHADPTTDSALTTQLQSLEAQQSELQNEASNYRSASSLVTGGQIVNAATVPSKPVKPKTVEYAILAGFLGLALGVGLALMLEFFDDGIRTKEDLELVAHNVPVLSLIPEIADWRDPHAQYLVSRSSPSSVPAEAYRSLRTSLQFLGLDRSIRTIQFTSPGAAEGKTTTLANVAVAMAQAGQRVVLVCCDLRRPRLHEFFNMSNQVGFTSVLLGEAALREALQPVPGLENLQILASGQIPPNPSELLSGARTEDLLSSLAEYADIVLIDSPPVLPVTDASVLAGRVDATVMVVAAGRSTRTHLSRALETLGRVDAAIAGTVLNRASESVTFSYYRYSAGAPVEPRAPRRNGKHGKSVRVPEEVGVG